MLLESSQISKQIWYYFSLYRSIRFKQTQHLPTPMIFWMRLKLIFEHDIKFTIREKLNPKPAKKIEYHIRKMIKQYTIISQIQHEIIQIQVEVDSLNSIKMIWHPLRHHYKLLELRNLIQRKPTAVAVRM